MTFLYRRCEEHDDDNGVFPEEWLGEFLEDESIQNLYSEGCARTRERIEQTRRLKRARRTSVFEKKKTPHRGSAHAFPNASTNASTNAVTKLKS